MKYSEQQIDVMNIHYSKILRSFALLGLLILSSCGVKKGAVAVDSEDVAVKAVIDRHYENELDFETLEGRLLVDYETSDRSQAVNVSLRMKKDDTIWLSGQLLGIPLAKVLITPNSVQYYEKITQTYFDGDFSLLSDLLGVELDFEKVQNLLIGQALYDLKQGKYDLSTSSRGYQLRPQAQELLKKLFLIDVENHKILAQQIEDTRNTRSLTISYPEYQWIGDRLLPDEIQIVANEGSESTRISINYRSMDFNIPLNFPFSIPSGYEEIVLR